MPPGSNSPLPPEELLILKKWIAEGAEWPEEDGTFLVVLKKAAPALGSSWGEAECTQSNWCVCSGKAKGEGLNARAESRQTDSSAQDLL